MTDLADIENDAETLATSFWEEGYLHLPGIFAPKLMDRVHQSILDHFGDQPAYLHARDFVETSGADVVPWFPEEDEAPGLAEIRADQGLAALTRAILGPGFACNSTMVMFSRAGSIGQPWHQDCPPEETGQFNLNRLLYAQDITEATGGELVLVPGSHRVGALPAGEPDAPMDGAQILAPEKGDLVLLHGHLWHSVRPVFQKRASVNFRAVPEDVSLGVTDVCVYRNMRYRFSTAEVIEKRI